MRFSDAPRLRVPDDTAGAVRAGHPWVYGPLDVPAAGTPVQLVDRKGSDVGYGLADEGAIKVRVLGNGSAPARTVEELIAERVRRAEAFRWQLGMTNTNAWRVIHGAGDGLPGIVADRYDGTVVFKLYSKAWLPHLDALDSVLSGLAWCTDGLRRLGVRNVDGEHGGVQRWGSTPESLVVEEHGMKMLVRPWVGQKTGTFLDQREHRRMIRGLSAGREVVNLFAYNGGFSVSAALGGASRVSTVDIAAEAVEDARENFRLNGLDPESHVFEVADAFGWKPRGRAGLWIVDPPSMARGEKAKNAARRAYAKLHRGLHRHLVRDGLLATSSCTAQLGWTEWTQAVREGLARGGSWSWVHRSQAPPDHPTGLGHPEGHYLKFALLRLLDAGSQL